MINPELEIFAEKLHDLSVDQLLSLQEQIIIELRTKTKGENNTTESVGTNSTQPVPSQKVAGFYRPSRDEVEAELAEMFTPEELAEINEVDLRNLPKGTKSLSQLVNEDREDRV